MPPVERKLTAAEIMTAAPRTCSRYSSVLEAVMIFRDADCGVVPVVEDGRPIGVLTDRDVALALADYPDLASRSVADLMTKDVISVPSDASMDQLKEKFGSEGVRRLMVVDTDNRLLGIISWADLAPHASDPTVGQVVSAVVEQP